MRMNFVQAFLLFASIITCSVIFACDVYDTDTAVCAYELERFCELDSFPTTIQAIYDSRVCLRKNRDILSHQCLDYLELEKPSIIESCFVELKAYCSNVVPGGFRLHDCLLGMPVEELTANCDEALVYDEEIIRSRGRMPPTTTKDYNWKKSVIEISIYVFTILKQVVKGKYLRGSLVSIDIIGNDLDKTYLLPLEGEDDNDDHYLTVLQESRQEYLQRVTKHTNNE